jgi:uncharacterized protein YfaQ (DUF2300 family)
MEDFPEPLKTIARMRQENVSEKRIADHLGLTKEQMWGRVRHWNRYHQDRPVPRPSTRPLHTKTARVLALIDEGVDPKAAAMAQGLTAHNAAQLVARLRADGLAPPPVTKASEGGFAGWQALHKKGAAPRAGTLHDVLDQLSNGELHQLLKYRQKGDNTMAAIVARLLRLELTQGRAQ